MKTDRKWSAAGKPGWQAVLVPKAALTVIMAATALLAVPAIAMAAPAQAAAKHSSTVSVSASPQLTVAGTTVKLTATVKSANPAPTGTVTFWSGSKKLCSAKLSNKSAHCGTEFRSAGDYAVRGVYSGDAQHAGATGKVTVVVGKDKTATKITSISPDRVVAGHSATVRVTVASQVPGLAATGKVSVEPTDAADAGKKGYSCTVTLKAASDGTGTCTITPPPPSYGTIEYVATYRGDGGHSGSKSGQSKVVVPDVTTTTVSFSPAMDTLTATVTNQAKNNISRSAGGTGTVSFTIGGTAIAGCGDVSLSYTAATGNTATCDYTPTGGSVTVTATYSGDEANLGSSGTVTA
jgi:hypothetical protein